MHSFQGSIPLTFISFYLDNQTPETGASTNLSVLPQSATNKDAAPSSGGATNPQTSPRSADSEVDVNAYAEAMVRDMESGRLQPQEQWNVKVTNTELLHTEVRTDDQVSQSLLPILLSTPIPSDAAGTFQASLTALESGLRVANTPGSQLPELFSTTQAMIAVPTTSSLSDDDDCESSVYEVPALPIQEHKVRFLTDLSEVEKTTEELSSVGCPTLYGGIPGMSESGAETGDQPDLTVLTQPQTELVTTTSRGSDAQLPELSGRARAILTYFDENNAFRLPSGQTTVAFTESQVYHLMRVLTDETLRMSYTTIERMILDAVRESPTTAPSRTGHFQIAARAQTPYRYADSDSSDAETGGVPTVDSEYHNTTDYGELSDSSSFGESDSAGEMALVSATFEASNRGPTAKCYLPHFLRLFFLSSLAKFSIYFPFQAVFQHVFNCAMSDIADHISTSQCFALEFEDEGASRFMSLRYWKGQHLCRVVICHSGLPTTDLTGELVSLTRILSAVSTKADIVACFGCPPDLVRTLMRYQLPPEPFRVASGSVN